MKRITFKYVESYAKQLGVIVQRARCAGQRGYEYWNPKDCGTIGFSATLNEAYHDLQVFTN